MTHELLLFKCESIKLHTLPADGVGVVLFCLNLSISVSKVVKYILRAMVYFYVSKF